MSDGVIKLDFYNDFVKQVIETGLLEAIWQRIRWQQERERNTWNGQKTREKAERPFNGVPDRPASLNHCSKPSYFSSLMITIVSAMLLSL